MSDLVKSVLTFMTAWILIAGSFIFLWYIVNTMASLETAILPESPMGIIIGGLIAILTMAGQFVFQSEAARATARSINTASQTAQAGQPTVTATSGPPATVTAEPQVTAEPTQTEEPVVTERTRG